MADDIISQGDDGEPGPWPRRLAVLAVLVALVVVAVRLVPHSRLAKAHDRGAPVAAGPVQLAGLGDSVPVALDETGAASLPGANWPAGQQLLLTDGPAWFWPATGRLMRISGLPDSSSGYVFSRVNDGWAVQPAIPARGCRGCAGLALPVYFLADGASLARRIGQADEVAPADQASAMWLTSYRPGADPASAAGTARLVRETGVPLGPPVRLPAGYQIVRGTGRGLLLASVVERTMATAYLLWDPVTRLTRGSFDNVIAASRGEIAWTPLCGTACSLDVLHLATGRDTAVQLPAGEPLVSGVFSPDGVFLALQVNTGARHIGRQAGQTGQNGQTGPVTPAGPVPRTVQAPQVARLVVAVASTGQLLPTPRFGAAGAVLNGFGWPGSTDRLVAELSLSGSSQVVSWRPGTNRAAAAIIQPGHAPAG